MYKKTPQHNHDKIFKAILVLLNSSALTLILFSYEKKIHAQTKKEVLSNILQYKSHYKLISINMFPYMNQ